MTVQESWLYYYYFLAQQKVVLADDVDIKALDTWLHLHAAIPNPDDSNAYLQDHDNKCLNYKLPRGWPTSEDDSPLEARNWNTEADKEPWRGFSNAIRLLAENQGPSGKAEVLRDEFDPAHERPHADHPELVRLEFYKAMYGQQYWTYASRTLASAIFT
ncbi:hypothetical protein V8C44DRAFT_362010 [Trichoderma aethiopicum]